MGTGSTLGALLAGLAVVGVNVAAACYFVVPWERVVNETAAPEGVPVVRLARVGTTLFALSLVPVAVGSWVTYAGTMARLTAGQRDLSLLDRVAMVLPGDLVAFGGLTLGLVALFSPLWVSAGVWVRRAVAPGRS